MSKTDHYDKDEKNVTLEEAYSKLVNFIDNSPQEKPQWKWLIEIAIIPLSTLVFSTIASYTTFEIQRRVDRSNTEQSAVESYFLQMEDILLNLEGVEGIIKWSRVTEKENKNFNKDIKDKLRELSSISITNKLSSITNDLSSIEQQIKENRSELNENIAAVNKIIEKTAPDSQLNKISIDSREFLSRLNKGYNDLLSLLDGLETTDINVEKELENKLHDLEFKLDEIQDIPNYEPQKYQIDREILPVHNQILKVQQKILEQTSEKSEISTIVEEIKKLDYDRNSKVDRYLLDEAKIVVQTKTSNVLFALKDQFRRQAIIEFLRESQLGFIPRSSTGDKEVDNIDAEEDDNLFKKSKILSGMALTRSKGIDLSGNDLSLIQLDEGKLNGANLKGTTLSQSMLSKAFLIAADLSKASLFNTNLEGATLIKANLKDANLTGANLKDANLTGANLKNTNLTGANLKGTIFNLGNNDKLNKTQIKSACNWKDAIYKSKWDGKRRTWIAIEPDNKDLIKEIKNHKSSDPKMPSNCSQWKNVNNRK